MHSYRQIDPNKRNAFQKVNVIFFRTSLLSSLTGLISPDDLPQPIDFEIHTGQPLPKVANFSSQHFASSFPCVIMYKPMIFAFVWFWFDLPWLVCNCLFVILISRTLNQDASISYLDFKSTNCIRDLCITNTNLLIQILWRTTLFWNITRTPTHLPHCFPDPAGQTLM